MKQKIKQLLKRKGWYYYLRYSSLFKIYESILKPEAKFQQKREVEFYRSFLPGCELVFDIGANDGHKTEAFLEFSKRVICIEPDEENSRLLNIRFRNNKKVTVERVAVSDNSGTATMHIHHAASAFNTLSPKWKQLLENNGEQRWNEDIRFMGTTQIQTTTLDELIGRYGSPDFIKIDVEGHEPWVLNGLATAVPFISFESLLPEYKTECLDCIKSILLIDGDARFNIAKDENLLFENFTSVEGIKEWIDQNENANTVEVIVKMNVN
jgi:FkbM family methyltransferase